MHFCAITMIIDMVDAKRTHLTSQREQGIRK